MAAFNVKASMQAILSKAQANGFVSEVQIGEPKSPKAPPGGAKKVFAAVQMVSATVVETVLDKSIEVHTVMVRLYGDAIAEELEETELMLADCTSELMTDVQEAFTLGSEIRNVDVAGQYGQALNAQWGHAELSRVMFRIVDITFPLIVQDVATHAA